MFRDAPVGMHVWVPERLDGTGQQEGQRVIEDQLTAETGGNTE